MWRSENGADMTNARTGWIAAAGFAAAYAASLLYLNSAGILTFDDALELLGIIGVGFSVLTWLLTLGLKRDAAPIARPALEGLLTIGVMVAIAAYLVWGKTKVDAIIPDAAGGGSDLGHLIGVTAGKLIAFVALPYLLFRFAFGHRLADFGLSRDAWRRLLGREGLAALVIGIAICAFQFYAGQAAEPIRTGAIGGAALWLGLPLTFAWLMVEAGLVEEFFFRALIQTRMAALFKSEWAGLVLMALIFGLIHAPGMVLRGAGDVEGLGDHPTALAAAAYSIVTQSVGGFYLGLLWMRTRNLPAVMIVHAATDLLPNLQGFLKPFGLAH